MFAAEAEDESPIKQQMSSATIYVAITKLLSFLRKIVEFSGIVRTAIDGKNTPGSFYILPYIMYRIILFNLITFWSIISIFSRNISQSNNFNTQYLINMIVYLILQAYLSLWHGNLFINIFSQIYFKKYD